ncbi:RagB/SusD family nutrient uptake outer membrane protein [Flavobacterium sp. Fl-318]|uniref:RagB/SusD family nutrient uptake outer membrane protein n=1 Tax=Flavobacterium cupriresistens TaxID=2893885 RepID=A0ABU4R647_9FLAO|nr:MULTISPECIES: RagB/SusD family nutrient uptake outer membrane protein [unclassified Flavobacterium]MDX6188003.1 RagB/SusD family nutrient uptake outer membrane protein [Flavobacterium sp. Fl-318]UFH42077.1 RagB/SusD family nutrient uptake outer membrane protein [Flavobacterium sp. F-323]
MKKFSKYIALFVAVLAITSCDNYLDVTPMGRVIPETLDQYRALLTRGYNTYPQHKSLTAVRTDELIMDEFGDEINLYKDIYNWNDANPDRFTQTFHYQDLYTTIFYTNVVINDASSKLDNSPEKNQLIGEAYALRAMAYFDLINLFGKPYNPTTAASDKGVPLALEIDLEQVYIPQSVEVIYNQIISDTDKAGQLINKDTQAKGINYRFSKVALYAFESRLYLYMQQWQRSLDAANKALVINNNLVDLKATPVLPNKYDSKESILALEEGYMTGLQRATYASTDLLTAYNRTADLRFPLLFVASGSKFKIQKGANIDQKCTFRTSELYLTKAETLLKLDKLADARTIVLSFIKNRYTAAGYTQLETAINTMNATDLNTLILQERQREFAVEGQRWFDLRRTSQKQIVHTLHGETHTLIQNDPRYTILFPANARLNNPNL